MSLDDRLHQAQPEAQPTLGATLVAPEQPIPDPGLLVGGDADTGVAHPQQRAVALAVHVHGDASAARRPATETRPPRGVYFTALSMRLAVACSSRTRSPDTTASAPASATSVTPFASATSR